MEAKWPIRRSRPKDVVVKADANGPVVRKRRRGLPGPQRVHRVGGLQERGVALLFACTGSIANGFHGQLGRVIGVVLDPLPRGGVIAVHLGGIPPGGDVVAKGLWGAPVIGFALVLKGAGFIVLGHVCLLCAVSGPAPQLFGLFRVATADFHVFRRIVVPFDEMRKPVVGHELNPERRQHVEKGGGFVIALCFFAIVR